VSLLTSFLIVQKQSWGRPDFSRLLPVSIIGLAMKLIRRGAGALDTRLGRLARGC